MKKILSMALTAVLILGLAAPAMAYTTPDFSDLPADNWAYGPVMRMADQGIIQGTGNNQFSPTMKVSAAQFLTLVGRIVFPETAVGSNDTWYGPYVAAAEANGLLTGTQVNMSAPEAEITRYDMAVILRAAAEKLGKAETLAQQSQVTDFGMIPNMYTEAVLAVYGMGLITGDQNGSFNGSNTMMRNELATVIDRLVALKAPGDATTDPTTPEVTPSQTPELKTVEFGGWMKYGTNGDPEEKGTGVEGVTFQLRYTEDNGATYTVIAEEVTGRSLWYGDDTPGNFEFTAEVEEAFYNDIKANKGQLYVSAETTVNGKRYVTQDRRTDGKATIVPIGKSWTRFFVDLVPLDCGETVDITVCGRAEARTYVGPTDGSGEIKFYGTGGSGGGNHYVLTNATVKVYFDSQQDGSSRVLLGETTADGGYFHDTFSIDTAYYRTTGTYYVVEVEAMLDGQLCIDTSSYSQTPITLSQLTGKEMKLWVVESDEYWEIGLGHSRP